MSLSYALDVAAKSLLITGSKTQTVAQNIINANKPGYTRKDAVSQYSVTNLGSVPTGVVIVGSTDNFLTKAVVGDVSVMGKNSAINDILDYYSSQLGSTEGATTLSGYLNQMYDALQQLSTSPEVLANKTQFVQVATNMTAAIRDLSSNVQSLRGQAEQDIATSIGAINTSVKSLDLINQKILASKNDPSALATLKDEQMYQLEQLGQEIDLQYYFTSQGTVQVYGGTQCLLGSTAHTIDYTPTAPVTGATTTFDTIDVSGLDITNNISGGRLAGLISARDSILVDEQAKLDELANTLSREANKVLNKGASIPPQPTLTGTDTGFTGATAFSGTGTVRVAITNNNGILQNYTDINLAAITTVGGLLTALNGITNVNASLNASGQLVISSTLPNNGVSINEMTSSVGASSQGFSDYFGLNDLFVNQGGEHITVKSTLLSNPDYLSVGVLSSGAITAGDYVVTRGDGSNAKTLADLLNTNVNFAAAGNFSSQSNSLNRYIQSIMADASNRAQIAQSEYDTSELTYSQTKDTLSSKSGVNLDEENTKLLDLQNNYQAAAQLVSTVKDMFDALLAAVR